jgi:hypothetical protein
MLFERDPNPVIVQRWLGHHSAAFTLKTYVHLLDGQFGSGLDIDAETAGGNNVANNYQATMHFNGQSTITLDGDRATGESYCIAHHLFTDDGERKLMVAHLRYDDTFVKADGAWFFAERKLYVDWTETRPSLP